MKSQHMPESEPELPELSPGWGRLSGVGISVESEPPLGLDPSVPVIFAVSRGRFRFDLRRFECSKVISQDKDISITCVPLHTVDSEDLLFKD